MELVRAFDSLRVLGAGVPVLATVTSERLQLKRQVLGGNFPRLFLSPSGTGILLESMSTSCKEQHWTLFVKQGYSAPGNTGKTMCGPLARGGQFHPCAPPYPGGQAPLSAI